MHWITEVFICGLGIFLLSWVGRIGRSLKRSANELESIRKILSAGKLDPKDSLERLADKIDDLTCFLKKREGEQRKDVSKPRE